MTARDTSVVTALLAFFVLLPPAEAQAQTRTFTRADTLRGSITPERAWWDVTFYDLRVRLDPSDSTVRGRNAITYKITGKSREMQIDLQEPLRVDSVMQAGHRLQYRREGNAFFVRPAGRQRVGETGTVTVYYSGRPKVAENPPWDGGLIWARGPGGEPWISVACQELGASVWWPNKDTQADEPDSQRVALTVPDSLQALANGRLRGVERGPEGTTYEWFVSAPINNYDVSAYVGRYAQMNETFMGERGPLTLTLWPLATNLERARAQFTQVQPVLRCFEHWFGPYPWYRDGYQLIDRVRRHSNPRVRELPAAALTAYARTDDRMRVLRAGFHIHLAKPIDPAELVTTIAALANRFMARRGDRPSD